jgi:DNA-binding NtrC family response regulator
VKTIKVLIIDPEADFTALLADRLNSWGFAATAANSGEEALAVLDRSRLDVVVLSIEAGDSEGVTTFGWIRSRYPDVKVILLAGKGAALAAVNSIERGAFDVLSHPVELGILIETIRRACRSRHRR